MCFQTDAVRVRCLTLVNDTKCFLFKHFQSDHMKHKCNVTLRHTLYPIAIEARSAVAAVSTGVVLAVSKLGALISIVCACPQVVREH